MRILFLNQYFPPDPAPTGILLRQIGDAMREAGHEADYASAGQDYRVRARGGRRLARELGGLLRIVGKGVAARRPDVVFSASSPPCLLAAAALVARRHGAKSAHWAMDLYPELAETLGEVPPPVAKATGPIMGAAYRRTDLVVALDDDMVRRLARYGVAAEAIRPWILGDAPSELAPNAPEDPPVWLYSGNLGRAHEWRTLLDAQAILESRGCPARLAFQGAGPASEPARARAAELALKRCEWLPFAPDEELLASLLRARVLVATQRPETQGLLWPSKLALLQRLPRPLLWVGPTDGAIATELRPLSRAGIFNPGEAAEIADWLEARFRDPPPGGGVASGDAGRIEGLRWWVRRLERLAG